MLSRFALVAFVALPFVFDADVIAQVAPPIGLTRDLIESNVIGTIATTESDAMATPATTQPLAQRLDAIFDDPKWESTWWGVIVQDLETSEILYDRNGAKSFAPASNLKLYTTAAALATLGADYQFETHIYATGTTDSQGILHGDIIVVGSGDPSISGRYSERYGMEDKPTTAILSEWADAITSAGIRGITGRIIGDDDIFDDSPVAGTWCLSYLQEWYAAENSGLAINENCWDVIIQPDGSVDDLLQTDYYDVTARELEVVPDDDAETTGPAEEEARLSINDVLERHSRNEIEIAGSIEEDSAPVKEWGTVHNGTLFTVTLLKEELQRRWNRAADMQSERENVKKIQAVDIDDLDEQIADHLKANRGTLLHTHVSPPLSQILAIINKPSQNFYADMVLKKLGAEFHERGSFNNGESVVKDLLTTAGANPRSLSMYDGSGLSRYNRVEPRQTLALLNYMATRPDFETFEASLPVMGVDGTMRSRMTGTAAEGNVKAKTGTIGSVRALSGYMTASNGRRLVFSMMANNYYTPTSDATEAQDRAILELLEP